MKKSRDQCLAVRFTFVWLDHTLEVSDLPQAFLHPKTSQSQVWEGILLFRTLLLINYQILFQRDLSLKIISHLKENKHGSHELPPTNLKFRMWADSYCELTNCQPRFAVCGKMAKSANLDHEMKIKKITCPSEKLLLKLTYFCVVVPTPVFNNIYFILTKYCCLPVEQLLISHLYKDFDLLTKMPVLKIQCVPAFLITCIKKTLTFQFTYFPAKCA